MKNKEIAPINREIIGDRTEMVTALAIDKEDYYYEPNKLGELRKETAIKFLRVARVASQESLGLFLGLDHKSSRKRFFDRLEADKLIKRSHNGPRHSSTLIFLTKRGFYRDYYEDLSTSVPYRPLSKIGINTLNHDLIVQALSMAQIETRAKLIRAKYSPHRVLAKVAFDPVLSGMEPKKPDAICRCYKYEPGVPENGVELLGALAIEYEASHKGRDRAEHTMIKAADLINPPLEHEPWEFPLGEDDPEYQDLLENRKGSGGIDQILFFCRLRSLAEKYDSIVKSGKAQGKHAKGLDGKWLYNSRKLPKGIQIRKTEATPLGRYRGFINRIESTMPK